MRQTILSAAFLAALFTLRTGPAYCSGPVRAFEAQFSPPVTQISSVNSGSVMLAVQLDPAGAGPGRVISIDKRGRTKVVEELGKIRELTVPGGRLWIAGETPAPGEEGRRLPVTGVRVFVSESGETYTVVCQTKGSYYELRHKDWRGRLLFVTGPRDAYGLKTVMVSRDGSKVLVVDEAPFSSASAHFGQRFYLYDKDGRLLMDKDNKDDMGGWLDIAEGFMAADGGYFVVARGMGDRPAGSLVMFDGEGREKWENKYFNTHTLTDDYGGVFRVKGGSGSLISFIDTEGELKVLERKGYGFDFWLSPGAAFAYVIIFKPFDLKRSGVPEGINALFPGAQIVPVDLTALLPEGHARPRVTIAPDGKAFIYLSFEPLGSQDKAYFSYYDSSLKRLWDETFFQQDATPQFVDGSRSFILKFGHPVTRFTFYEVR